MPSSSRRVVVFAPNWLGDAVMAVPCLELLKRDDPAGTIAVAARRHLAPLYEMVGVVSEVVPLQPPGRMGGVRAALADARRLRAGQFDMAVLLPNSFRSALVARLAAIPSRVGYATDGRGWLLTARIARPSRPHMVEYYRTLMNEVGSHSADPRGVGQRPDRPSDSRPLLAVPAAARERVRGLLAAGGWQPGDRLVGMAPGAAYGTAKQWLPERFARLAGELRAAGVRTVLVGTGADREVCERIADQTAAVINLAGATTLPELGAVIAECASFVTNDSGAMHVAVAVGVPVTAIFGPTQEWETGPDYPTRQHRPSPHTLISGDVACRPCMLRECPTEHECMVAVTVERVKAAVCAQLDARKTP